MESQGIIDVELPLKKYCLQNPLRIKTMEHKQHKLLMDPKQVNYRPLQQ